MFAIGNESMHAEHTHIDNGSPGGDFSPFIGSVSNSAGAEPVCRECRYCHSQKPLLEFGRSTSKHQCNQCFEAMYKLWYQKNKKRVAKKRRALYKKNRKKILQKKKEGYLSSLPVRNAWRDKNRDRIRKTVGEWQKVYIPKRRREDPLFKLTLNLRTRVNSALKGRTKSDRTMNLVGCTIEFLKSYLESQFAPEMNWGNYGSYWHVDHRRPCKSFNLLDSEEQKKCFHYSNLQPLEGKENMSKGAKIHPKYNNV